MRRLRSSPHPQRDIPPREALRVAEVVWLFGRSEVSLRIAIFHDYLTSVGGGENVALCLAKALDADLITTDFNRDVLRLAGAEGIRVIDLGPLSGSPPMRQIQASLAFAGADFEGYDIHVFSGNWSKYASGSHRPNILYCHTPVRAFYDLKEKTLARVPPWQRPMARTWIRLHSIWDRATVSRIDAIVANSENTRKRISRYYGRESTIVYPPIATGEFLFDEVGDYWLSVNRLYPEKRVDMQVEIFRRLPEERLIIVGDKEREVTARNLAASLNPPSNVELVGAVDRKRLVNLYAGCKGLITTAVDEDFGITPVEAMASGKAVLATDEGGYRESVVHGKTGWLLPSRVEAFVERIRSLRKEELEGMRGTCIARARLFDEGRFIERMTSLIRSQLAPSGESREA